MLSLAGVLVLFILVLVGGEIVFATDIPRNLVVNALQSQLGLRVTAGSVSTGWLGHTTLRDVTVTLPLADKAFLTIPEARVRHSSLPRLLITGNMNIYGISSDHAELDVIQDAQGNWNLQQVARLLDQGVGGGGPSNGSSSGGRARAPALPEVEIHDATLRIADNRNRSANIEGLSVDGKSVVPLVWECDVAVPGHVKISGKIAPGGAWAHEFEVAVGDVREWVTPWIRSWPQSAHLSAKWVGQINAGRLSARVDMLGADYGPASASGPVELSAADGKATIFPRQLTVRDGGYDAILDDGQIIVDADQVRSEGLALQIAGGRASVDGKAALANGAATIHAAWRDVTAPASVKQSGDLTLEITPTLKEPKVQATLNTRGSIGSSAWTAQFIVDGGGKDLGSLSISARAPQLLFQTAGHKTIDLSGMDAQVAELNDRVFSLTEFRLGNGQRLVGAGQYSLRNRAGWVTLDGRDWTVPGTSSVVLDVDLNLWMTSERLHLEQLYLREGLLKTYAQGDYMAAAPKPVSARVYVMKMATAAPISPRAFSPGGTIRSEFDLSGTVRPIELAFKGDTNGRDVSIGARSLGDLKLAFDGTVHADSKNLIRVDVQSRDIKVLGGNWTVAGCWPVEHSALRFDTISVEHLSLPLLTAHDNIEGTLDGKWSVDVRRFSADGIVANGSAVVNDFSYGRTGGTPLSFSAEQVQIPQIAVEGGEVNVQSVTAVHRQSDNGRANISAWADLAHPSHVWLSVDVSGWPVRLSQFADAVGNIGAKGQFDADLASRSAWGDLDVNGGLLWGGRSLASLEMSSDFEGRRVDVRQVQLQALDGTASGEGSVDLNNPLGARADLSWSGLDLSKLREFSATANDVSGVVDGSLAVHPATTPRPLEPLQMVLHVEPRNMQVAHIKLGAAQMFGFIGADRIVLDDSPDRVSQVAMAGGRVVVWGRISKPIKDFYESLMQLTLEDINLDEIIPADSKIARTPGSVNGTITMGQPLAPDLTFGNGQLTVSNSDLAEIGPVSFLYNLMHIGHNPNKPEGNGSLDFEFQGRTLNINALRYFDRGTEIRASGFINQYRAAPHCWLEMTAVGSVRPFQSIDLPGLADLDNALGAVQHDALAVRISGYMDHLNDKNVIQKIPFSSIGHELQTVIFGDVKSAKGQSSQ